MAALELALAKARSFTAVHRGLAAVVGCVLLFAVYATVTDGRPDSSRRDAPRMKEVERTASLLLSNVTSGSELREASVRVPEPAPVAPQRPSEWCKTGLDSFTFTANVSLVMSRALVFEDGNGTWEWALGVCNPAKRGPRGRQRCPGGTPFAAVWDFGANGRCVRSYDVFDGVAAARAVPAGSLQHRDVTLRFRSSRNASHTALIQVSCAAEPAGSRSDTSTVVVGGAPVLVDSFMATLPDLCEPPPPPSPRPTPQPSPASTPAPTGDDVSETRTDVVLRRLIAGLLALLASLSACVLVLLVRALRQRPLQHWRHCHSWQRLLGLSTPKSSMCSTSPGCALCERCAACWRRQQLFRLGSLSSSSSDDPDPV